jgi:DMSO reductase family type II enzyme heme b subunit
MGAGLWLFLSLLGAPLVNAQPTEADLEAGEQIYLQRCAHCHGVEGDGVGASTDVVYPKPRDFTSGVYKFRTRHETEEGNLLAADSDLARSIREGLHGSSMPGWETVLSGQQIDQLVHYIKTFADVFEEDTSGPDLSFANEVPSSPESIAKGKEVFETVLECHTCHGTDGRGNGEEALAGLEDDWGHRIWPANLTKPWTYRGGSGRRDIFRNISLGIAGTPMPPFADPDPLVEARETDDPEEKQEIEALARELQEDIWHTVNYVQSLWTYPQQPEVKATLTAKRVDGALPMSPDDAAWQAAAVNYYPLAGQVIQEPRLFAPMTVGVELQALHNGEEVAFRLVWDDRTDSKPGESDEMETYVDAIALQFSSKPLSGMEKPYFLMGDASYPTDLWYWRNDPGDAVLIQTQGARSFQVSDNAGGLVSQGQLDNGQYRLVIQRALQTEQTDTEVQFPIGAFIPFSVTGWDGSNGEFGGYKRTVMAWYNLYLEPEPSKAPLYLLLVGIGFGLIVEFSALFVTRKNHG